MVNILDILSFASENLIKLIGAVLIFLVGLLLARLISKLSYKILNKIKFNSILYRRLKLDLSAEESFATIVKYVLYAVSLIYAFDQLGITSFVFKFVLTFVLILAVLLIILSIIDTVPNLIAGIHLFRKKLVSVGDYIKVKDINGKVLSMNIAETKIETDNKDIIILPNRILSKNKVVKEN